ncbi:MAG: prepilin-type N-terminal cleavage/methylation domain-containing protein [Verrucomicrobiota bacterium]
MRTRRHIFPAMHPAPRRWLARRGFTLIEIMIVVAIMALVLGIGIPAMFRAAEKDSLRQVVTDVMDACASTRAQAILTGEPKEMIIHPREHTIVAPGKSDTVTIPDRIIIDLMGVNFIELQEADEARVRFFPNSTCDEFTIVLRAENNEMRKISLDVITATTELESDPHKFLKR